MIEKVIAYAKEQYLVPLALEFSPIKGPEGNIEYLMHIKKEKEPTFADSDISALIAESHNTLK